MNEKEMRQRKISAESFAAWELPLYLDTHPGDVTAHEAWKKHMAKRDELVKAFEEKYGPFTGSSDFSAPTGMWLRDPWPWEFKEEHE